MGGAKSYDGEKAWTSINHSILSVYGYTHVWLGMDFNSTGGAANSIFISLNRHFLELGHWTNPCRS